MKVCTNCKLEKEFVEFYKRSEKAGGGRQPICIPCWKGQNKRYYQNDNHKKDIRKTAVEQRKNSRRFVYNYYLSHPCVDCGETDPVVLELDHVRGEKIASVSVLVSSGGCSIEKIKEEIEKCEVRCANCHRKKTAKQQDWYKDIMEDELN